LHAQWRGVIPFLARRWFLVLLALLLVVGTVWAVPLRIVRDVAALRYGIVAVVLFLTALPLEAGSIWQTLRRPAATFLGVGCNFGLLPLVAWAVSPLLPLDLAAGLLVVAVTPCTLASAAVWTRRAGGNDAVALLVTLVTNLSCFIVTPLWLAAMMRRTVESSALRLDTIIVQLGLLVLLPVVLAQLARLYGPLGRWATRRVASLSVLAQCGILLMVLIGAVQTGLRLRDPAAATTTAWAFVLMVAIVLGIHLFMVWAGFTAAGALGLPRGDRIAVAFAGSQKTLMVGVYLALELQANVLPMVTYHVGQLLADTLIADRWKEAGQPPPADEEPAEAERG
jgi:sodium/bile acid cotransporter 7